MAFQLPALPNFNPQITPMPDPLQKAAQMASLKQMLSATSAQQTLLPLQVQEQQARIKQQDVATQTAQLELESQKAMMKAWSDPEFTKKLTGGDQAAVGGVGFDPNAMLSELSSRGVLPKDAQGLVNSFVERSKNVAMMTKDQLSNYEKAHDEIAGMLAPITDMPVEKAAAALQNLKTKLLKSPIPGLDQTDAALIQHADLEHLPAMINVLGLNSQIADYHKKTAESAKAGTEATEAEAEATGQVTPKMATAQSQKLEVAKAEATARGQIQLALEPLRLQIQQQFGNQKDARDKIETSVLKPFQDKMTDINMARTAIAQAGSNPVAARAAVFKMVGVAQPAGSHRVLPMEFEAFKYPGGVADQIKEKFNNFLKGEPWTPEIAQAANSFIDGQEQAAHTNLNSGVDNVNKLYGTSVGTGLKQDQQPGGGQGVIYARDAQGKLHSAPAGTPLPAGWKQEQK